MQILAHKKLKISMIVRVKPYNHGGYQGTTPCGGLRPEGGIQWGLRGKTHGERYMNDKSLLEINNLNKRKANTNADMEATAVETNAVVASDVGAGAGAGAKASVAETETAARVTIITSIKAKRFIIFIVI
ncbi:hypothetical protein E3N88_24364 [Mikania micrantha]|uniref:Uncharacterized protein n=1 Tax=Mikania micrantha TaxID=192012 RepID=A0A5N6N2X4_9ASTR|nr:hypothetical protein E3N88_24364 [Mikania micrantha]